MAILISSCHFQQYDPMMHIDLGILMLLTDKKNNLEENAKVNYVELFYRYSLLCF